MPVPVRVSAGDDGTVLITPAAAADPPGPDFTHADPRGPDFTYAVLDVAGAVLAWPVLGGPVPPTAYVHDAGRAQQWLWALYGERVALAVHERALGRTAADRTALADVAARLGLGHWAARWWPASYTDGIPALEPDVLGVELAALTHRCQQLFDDGGDQPDDRAAELIEDHRAALAPLIQWWHATAHHPAHTARHLETVLTLVDAAADGAGLEGPALRHLRTALGERHPAGVPAGPGPPVDLGALFARHDGYALAAGAPTATGGRVIARGAGANDWRRYPHGYVDAAEDAVSWTARALGARRRIEVEVVAHRAAPAATGTLLVADVRVHGGHRGRVPLTRRDDLWAGYADVDLDAEPPTGPGPAGVEVGVLLPGFDPGAASAHAADDRAARDAVRALARQRLATAAQSFPYDAAQSFLYDAPQSFPYGEAPHTAVSTPFLAETAAAATAADEDY
ncbi:hypothetical protein AT728_08310 [Streptomyces silvensis]|uniref:Uncharacterized protein n=1 Tax=Streptomyces silvensis TaxID=1765722 RepID=A0A0W7X888_9ACTN|nr:hypothetical protein AT728_08310 [Streptomyces silvensis]